MKIFKIMAVAMAALLGAALPSAFAQGVPPQGTFAVNTITLPYSILTNAQPAQAATSTNLGAGWSTFVTNTLITTLWNTSSNAFISTTNTTIVTNTTFADIPIPLQKDVAIALAGNCAGTSSNIVYTFAPWLDTGTIDTVDSFSISNAANATNLNSQGLAVITTNFNRNTIGGYGGLRLITVTWTGTNSVQWTNGYFKYVIKRQAF